jgi:8-oxo-dGTP diphosphatase
MTTQPSDAIAAASMCLWRENTVLLVKRPEGVWALPGGKLEPGETTELAAAREVLEETGIVAEALESLGTFDIQRRKTGQHFRLTCHFGRWISGEAEAASDALDVRWASLDEALKLPLAPHVKDVIRAAIPLARL